MTNEISFEDAVGKIKIKKVKLHSAYIAGVWSVLCLHGALYDMLQYCTDVRSLKEYFDFFYETRSVSC